MQKITLASKALFDFDKAVLKPEGMAAIDTEIIAKLRDVQKLELVLVTGHTDRIGSQAYNQKLSERRADAVRNYLVSKGVAKDKIETLGMGKTQPVPGVTCTMTAMKALIACLAPNRRVEVEVKGEARQAITPRATHRKSPASRGAFFHLGFRFRVTLRRMQTCDLRIDAGWIVPIEPAGALPNHSLIVDAGPHRRRRAVGARRDREFAAREHLALPRHVLLPGLVNAHTHAAMSLFRGIADDAPLKVWLEQHIWPREAQFVTPDFVYDGARLAAAEMLRGGHHVLQRHVLLPGRERARLPRARDARDAGPADPRFSDALCRRTPTAIWREASRSATR